jgi:hypothetical protein
VFTRSALRWLLIGAVAFSPFAVVTFRFVPYGVAACVLVVFAAYAFSGARSRRAENVALVLLSFCFAVTLSELIARPLLYYLFDIRPADRYLYVWPPLPQLHRYVALVNFEGVTYGDLAAAAGRPEWREKRRIRFVTDAYGFRNEQPSADSNGGPLDAILLGDSFGVAASTSQENTVSSVLARAYHLHVYNLSISRENPRQEYANLALEGARLKTASGAAAFSSRGAHLRIALAATTVLAIAVTLAVRSHRSTVADPRKLATWSSPTAFLLETPGKRFLNQTPMLGEPLIHPLPTAQDGRK